MTESCSNASVSSTSSLNSSLPDTEDDQTIASILAEEENSQVAGKLGKRLSHLDSIPHTPRVNGEIPDVNDATLDHERLSDRLATYGLEELQIDGDGNCQTSCFKSRLPQACKEASSQAAKAFQKVIRKLCANELQKLPEENEKIRGMGDHVTLQAAADRFGAKICLVTSFRDTCYIEIIPKDKNPTREIWLSFWSEVHYNSLYAIGDVPTRKTRRKHWLF